MTTLDNCSKLSNLGPHFEFGRSRWASVREQNVKTVAELWSERPNLVQILEDPRLGTAQLVMLRKDMFEQLVSSLAGLASGRNAICVELEQITRISTALHKIVSRDPQTEVALLAETVLESARKLKTQVVPAGPVSRLEPPDLSADERDFIRVQDELDTEDD